MSHSPTPWKKDKYQADNLICDVNGKIIAATGREDMKVSAENINLIIKAVNQHDQHETLVAENAALKQRIKEIDKRLEFIENNDLYWNMDDPDETGISPEEIACNNSLDKEAYMKFGGKKYVEGFIAFKATELDDEGNPCDWEPVYYENEEDAASSWRLSVAALQESQP